MDFDMLINKARHQHIYTLAIQDAAYWINMLDKRVVKAAGWRLTMLR